MQPRQEYCNTEPGRKHEASWPSSPEISVEMVLECGSVSLPETENMTRRSEPAPRERAEWSVLRSESLRLIQEHVHSVAKYTTGGYTQSTQGLQTTKEQS
jgi:hypothetical protein